MIVSFLLKEREKKRSKKGKKEFVRIVWITRHNTINNLGE